MWVRGSCLIGLVVAVLCFAGVQTDAGEPEAPFPVGLSQHAWDGMPYEVHMPNSEAVGTPGHSLIVTLTKGVAPLASLVKHGYVLVGLKRHPKGRGREWSVQEVKRAHALLDHLIRVLDIAPNRIHAVANEDPVGDLATIAWDEHGRFVSFTTLRSRIFSRTRAKSRLRKMGLLGFGVSGSPLNSEFALNHEPRYRTTELRRTEGKPFEAEYFRFWLGAMEGRFKPGPDLSLPWQMGIEAADLQSRLRGSSRPILLYFWSPSDRTRPSSKKLHTEIFLHHRVRSGGGALDGLDVPLVPRESGVSAHAIDIRKDLRLFKKYGLTKTPAVVVPQRDGSFVVLERPLDGAPLFRGLQRATEASARR